VSWYSGKLLTYGAEVLLPLSELKTDPLLNLGSSVITGVHDDLCEDSQDSLVESADGQQYSKCMAYNGVGANSTGTLDAPSDVKSISFVFENDNDKACPMVTLRNSADDSFDFRMGIRNVEVNGTIYLYYHFINQFASGFNLTLIKQELNIYPIYFITTGVNEFKLIQYDISAGQLHTLVTSGVTGMNLTVDTVEIGDIDSGYLQNNISENLTDGTDTLIQGS